MAHPADLDGETSYTFTCGKIDAGIAVLIGSHAHLIEFPSLLLPPGCEPGSIVSITCTRDHVAERAQADSFWDLQTKIVDQFGMESPQPPNLRLRSITQTSATLEWDELQLAQCKLLSLSIWKNGQRLGTLPNPLNNTSTKLSGLDLDSEYTFHLVMKTTGGSFHSPQIKVKTHSLHDTSGIHVCFGVISEELKEQSKEAIQQLDGRWSDKIQIDTTHFVCTMPYQAQPGPNKSTQPSTFPSLEYQRALQLSIPVVQPSWLQACLHERKMVPIAAHYLGAQPPPLRSSSTSTPSAGPSGRPRSSSKPNDTSSTLISPRGTTEFNPSTPGSSGSTSRLHGRANSVPTVATASDAGRLPDQIEKPTAGLAVIIEGKDNDVVASQNINGSNEGTTHGLDQSSRQHSRPNTTTESDSEKTFKLSTPEQLRHEPHVPTPPRFAAALSDILKENVDSPAENDGSPSGLQSIEFSALGLNTMSERTETTKTNGDSGKGEPVATSSHTSASPSNKLTSQPSGFADPRQRNRGMVDDGDDDPFSAASPTISHPSPLGDGPSFNRSNSITHTQFGGLLSPPSHHPSPVILPTTGAISPHETEESPAPAIPDHPLEKDEDVGEVAFKKNKDVEELTFKKNEDLEEPTPNENEDVDERALKKNEDKKDIEPKVPLTPSTTTLEPVVTSSETGGSNMNHGNGGSEVFDEVSIGSDQNHQAEVLDGHEEQEEVLDSKGESGSGDTFFSTASALPTDLSHQDHHSTPSSTLSRDPDQTLNLENLLELQLVDLGNQVQQPCSPHDQLAQSF
ncbi:hypothetical protein VP01_36g15 [Puccinia sorghi]|uniref:Uncharacterized protein n=1 Tax=Puccinia sorghi TaxID=27349 RepID=A0A0L6UU71_9BASI|nr:hypothetical protein VP01_36g15 [Puccinia sorghi]